jgi:DNA-binding HxlR family transcriptional regulator
MTGYGQFCPVAQALELVGERWTLLVVRELLCGNYRFGELMHGLPLISRSVLSQRLKTLEAAGIIDHDGTVYQLTPAGRELEPVVMGLGTWGQRWTKGKFDAKDLDPVLMMWDLRRHMDVERLPEDHTVVRFWYRDQPAKRSRFWLRIERPEVDLCLTNPGFEVQLSIETTLRTMVDVWMGNRDLREALQTGAIELAGAPGLVKTFPRWLLLSPFAKVERAMAG